MNVPIMLVINTTLMSNISYALVLCRLMISDCKLKQALVGQKNSVMSVQQRPTS